MRIVKDRAQEYGIYEVRKTLRRADRSIESNKPIGICVVADEFDSWIGHLFPTVMSPVSTFECSLGGIT